MNFSIRHRNSERFEEGLRDYLRKRYGVLWFIWAPLLGILDFIREERMRCNATQIRFQGQDFIMVGNSITTPEDFKLYRVSYASVADGKVWRFGEVIGQEEDIEYGDEIEVDGPSSEQIRTVAANPVEYGWPETREGEHRGVMLEIADRVEALEVAEDTTKAMANNAEAES